VDKQRRAEWRAGVYVRVHGHVSNFGRNQEVIAFNIRPITDYNEVGWAAGLGWAGLGWVERVPLCLLWLGGRVGTVYVWRDSTASSLP
jgi:hypothetical protein